jgi:hypothetical protein
MLARLGLIGVLALVLLAVLWIGRDDTPGAPVKTKLGTTTQGRTFKLGLDAKDRPAAFSTDIAAVCASGTTISMPWDPAARDGIRFERHGDRLHVEESDTGYKLAMDAQVAHDGGLRGTLLLVVHVRPKGKPAFDCTSPHVRFFAGR